MKVKNTLIIEDTEMDNYILDFNIKRAEVSENIAQYSSAVDALEYLKEIDLGNFPDLIFLDLNLPVMNGFEFLELYNLLPAEKKQKCKIVVQSSSKDTKDIAIALAMENVYKYISKPTDHFKLDALFEQLFEDKASD